MSQSQNDSPAIDLDAYFERIAYAGSREPSLGTLAALQLQHVTHIPFENIDVQLERPIRLDLPSVQAKLVHARRGGYCFEHNTLLSAVLRKLGFQVTTLTARVRYQATQMTPRTHMLLRVASPGGDVLVDSAFGGGWGPTAPIAMILGTPQPQDLVTFELTRRGDNHHLFVRLDDAFTELYQFTLEPQYAVDFEVANHFTSTHPSSRFVQSLIVTRAAPGARYVLRDLELSIRTAAGVTRQTLDTEDAWRAALGAYFNLSLPDEAPLASFKFMRQRRS